MTDAPAARPLATTRLRLDAAHVLLGLGPLLGILLVGLGLIGFGPLFEVLAGIPPILMLGIGGFLAMQRPASRPLVVLGALAIGLTSAWLATTATLLATVAILGTPGWIPPLVGALAILVPALAVLRNAERLHRAWIACLVALLALLLLYLVVRLLGPGFGSTAGFNLLFLQIDATASLLLRFATILYGFAAWSAALVWFTRGRREFGPASDVAETSR